MFDRTRSVNVDRIKRLMNDSGLDAILVSSPEAIPSVSGFYHWDVALLQEFPHYVLWPLQGDPCFIAPSRRGTGRRSAIITDNRGYVHEVQRKGNQTLRESEATPIQRVAEAIKDRALTRGTIGVEMRHMPVGYVRELQSFCPEIQLEDCEEVLDRLRAIKAPNEIGIFRRAAYVTDKAITLGLSMTREGDSEKQANQNISMLLLQFGAESIGHAVLCAGERCHSAHHAGGNEALRDGELVIADFGGLFKGYRTDIIRMGVVNKGKPRQIDWYKRMARAHFASIGRIVPGLAVKELVQIIRDDLGAVGMATKYEMLGHSIGIGVHDWPMITPYSNAVLEESMILALEVMTEDAETRDRYEIEDIVLVTASGAEVLSNYGTPGEFIVLG